jgi:hypothetical protein
VSSVGSFCGGQELEEEFDKARPLLKEALKQGGWSATPDSSYVDYCEVLEKQSEGAGRCWHGGLAWCSC